MRHIFFSGGPKWVWAKKFMLKKFMLLYLSGWSLSIELLPLWQALAYWRSSPWADSVFYLECRSVDEKVYVLFPSLIDVGGGPLACTLLGVLSVCGFRLRSIFSMEGSFGKGSPKSWRSPGIVKSPQMWVSSHSPSPPPSSPHPSTPGSFCNAPGGGRQGWCGGGVLGRRAVRGIWLQAAVGSRPTSGCAQKFLSGIVSCDAAAIRIRIRIVRCQRPAKRQKHKPCETRARFLSPTSACW